MSYWLIGGAVVGLAALMLAPIWAALGTDDLSHRPHLGRERMRELTEAHPRGGPDARGKAFRRLSGRRSRPGASARASGSPACDGRDHATKVSSA